MVERYVRIRQDIKKVDAVEELIPTGGKQRKLLALFEHLKKFESVCKRLQRDETNMADVRLLFDSLVAEYPVIGEYLKSSAKIDTTGKKRKEREEDYASMLLQGKKKKLCQVHAACAADPPTSNTVERLFSQCKLVLTPLRRAMMPANFEQLAFLRVNHGLWDITSVASCSEEDSI
eukprot:jgi/Phyca11/132402/e_gw1.160.10.1